MAILYLLSTGIIHIALPPPPCMITSEQSCLLVLYFPGSTHKMFHGLQPSGSWNQKQHPRPERSHVEQEQQISVASKARQHSPAYSCPWASSTHFHLFIARALGGISCCLPAFHIQVSYPASTRQHCLGLAGDCVRSQPVSSFYQPPSRPAERLSPPRASVSLFVKGFTLPAKHGAVCEWKALYRSQIWLRWSLATLTTSKAKQPPTYLISWHGTC